MHDAQGRPLAVGDIVLIPARVTSTSATEDYCNLTVESILTRRPDSLRETFSGFNTAIVLRANSGDSIAPVLIAIAPPQEPAPPPSATGAVET